MNQQFIYFWIIKHTYTPTLSLTRLEPSISCKGSDGDTTKLKALWYESAKWLA